MARDVNGVPGEAGRSREEAQNTQAENTSMKPDTLAMGKRHNDLTQEEVWAQLKKPKTQVAWK